MFEYNSGYVFMDLPAAQKFFRYPNQVTSIEVMTDNVEKSNKVKKDLVTAVGDQARIFDWRESNSSFLNALAVERNVMFLILTLIILVAAFNIISSMIMLVKDKGKDIAIMRTMGATQSNMLKIFTLTGSIIGLSGTVVGALLGIAFATNIDAIKRFLEGLSGTELFASEIYFLSKLPAVINWEDVLLVVGMAFALSILATIYPAWRASRLDPVEALRYE
jgi:lipoprotein-releasing system permease protein